MVAGTDSTLECAVCGIHGKASIRNKKMSVAFSRREQEKSRLKIEGKRIHHFEIMEVSKALEPLKSKIPAKLKKYKDYKSPSVPTRKAR
jgi:hypothetical protein